MQQPYVYLAGPIAGLTYQEATHGWRAEVAKELRKYGIASRSPMRGKDGVPFGATLLNQRYDHYMATDSAVFTRDTNDVRNAAVVLANLLAATSVSIGTVSELAYAHENHVPIVLLMEKDGNPHDHIFVRAVAGYWVETLSEALHCAVSLLDATPLPLRMPSGVEVILAPGDDGYPISFRP